MADDAANGKSFRKAKGGRPPKLNDELMEKVCTYLRHGAYVETAAAASGISKVILYEWMKKGNANPKSIHGRFLNAVEIAIAEGQMLDLAAISKARSKSWQASAWRISRRHPDQWAATHRPPVASASPDTGQNSYTLNYNLDEDKDDEPKADEP